MSDTTSKLTMRCHCVCVTVIAGVLLTACTAKSEQARDSVATPAAQVTADSAKNAMAGMPGMGGNVAATDSMQAHMQTLAAMSADQVAAALPSHRQMVANMLSQMNGDMRSMNMPADAAWTALVDSLRQDLVRFPELSKAQAQQALPAHTARVSRLMQMHKDMMGKMGK